LVHTDRGMLAQSNQRRWWPELSACISNILDVCRNLWFPFWAPFRRLCPPGGGGLGGGGRWRARRPTIWQPNRTRATILRTSARGESDARSRK
jgi:hypothetical protein